MSTIESLIGERLATDATLTALVGERIYYLGLPDLMIYPCVCFKRISTRRDSYAMAGGPHLSEGLFQFDCYAKTPEAMAQVRDAVRARMDRYQDKTSTPVVQDCFIESEKDDELEDAQGDGRRLRVFWGELDVMVKWNE
jgi:hypothetical protein